MATLTITVKEDVLINGVHRGSENVIRHHGITRRQLRVVDVPNDADTDVLKFGSADGAGTINRTKLKYLRFTNLGTTTCKHHHAFNRGYRLRAIPYKAGGGAIIYSITPISMRTMPAPPWPSGTLIHSEDLSI